MIDDISVEFAHKSCFCNFSAVVHDGEKIGVIGRNGSGKSSLLTAIYNQLGSAVSYLVPQIIRDNDHLSGGERFNKKLSEALSHRPDVLLLDEPTNHLDIHNRKMLIKMLKTYNKIVIVATHDVDILQNCIDTIWYIHDERVSVFAGAYDDFIRENQIRQNNINQSIATLKHSSDIIAFKVQKARERLARSKASGEKKVRDKRWMKSVGSTKSMSSEKSRGKAIKALSEKQMNLLQEKQELFVYENLVPSFNIICGHTHNATVAIIDGAVGYSSENLILHDINIHLERSLAIIGPNASGKSTLAKAIIGDPLVYKKGYWCIPKHIAYLDQHYASVDKKLTPVETISRLNSNLSYAEIRKYLNGFLFRKNDEINIQNEYLSGGEIARLCLAQITLAQPQLLILDEITNNIDIETKRHIVQVLQNYCGKLIIISHDMQFIRDVGVQQYYEIESS